MFRSWVIYLNTGSTSDSRVHIWNPSSDFGFNIWTHRAQPVVSIFRHFSEFLCRFGNKLNENYISSKLVTGSWQQASSTIMPIMPSMRQRQSPHHAMSSSSQSRRMARKSTTGSEEDVWEAWKNMPNPQLANSTTDSRQGLARKPTRHALANPQTTFIFPAGASFTNLFVIKIW